MLVCLRFLSKPLPNIPPKRVLETGAMRSRLIPFKATKALKEEPSCGFNGSETGHHYGVPKIAAE